MAFRRAPLQYCTQGLRIADIHALAPRRPEPEPPPGEHEHAWNPCGSDSAKAALYYHPRLIIRGMFTLRDAAVAGVGQLPGMMMQQQIARGELVHVIPDWRPRRGIVHAAFPSRRGLLPSVRALVDHLADKFDALDEE